DDIRNTFAVRRDVNVRDGPDAIEILNRRLVSERTQHWILIREGSKPKEIVVSLSTLSEVRNTRIRRHSTANGPRLPKVSEHFPEGKIDASGSGQRMPPLPERSDTVIDEASGTAPHRDVTAFEGQASYRIGAAFAAPQKYGRQAERNGDNRSPSILLVTVLMEAEFGASHIAIDQASVGFIMCKPGLGSGMCSDVEERRGHRRPGRSSLGILRVVAITGLGGYPTDT